MDFKKSVLKEISNNFKPCPICFGIGKVKAMQSIANSKGSFRGKDVEIKCSYCEGSGMIT